ncbi:hypothetical protein FS749_003100 [Ceratobasidium sp. UAMH 11750]|nr:hypothetical protein FS749_003100 [Ceratobasidium sp. UAMH 11750]
MAHLDHTPNTSADVCTILLFDSLAKSGKKHYKRYFRIIREYLQVMAGAKIDKPVKVLDYEIPPGWIQDRVVQVPQQENTWDCGLYVLDFASRFVTLKDKVLVTKAEGSCDSELWGNPSGPSLRSEFRRRIEEKSARWMEDRRL